MGGVEDKTMTRFKTNTTENYSKPTRVNNVYRGQKKLRKPKMKNQSEDKIITATEDRIIRNIKKFFEREEEDYYKPVRVGNFYSNNYVEYENNGDRNKTLSIEECLGEIKPYLKDINKFKKSDTWKIQLAIAIKLVSSKDTDEERVIHSKSDNIEIMIYG